MKKIIVFTLINFLFIKSFGQENNENVEPRGEWRVSKEYNDQGNMISYDSVYVWSSGRIPYFDFFKNDSLPHHFKGFIRDFEIPKFNFIERDSLGLGIRDIFQGFEFPKMDFHWIENDSLFLKDSMQIFFKRSEFDFQKQIDELKKQMEAMQKNFKEKQKSEAIEPKNIEEKKYKY
jgi:hypothetical protein